MASGSADGQGAASDGVGTDLKIERELMWQKLRQMIADGHASGIVEWTEAEELIGRARARAGLPPRNVE